jgi:hypothetical protein
MQKPLPGSPAGISEYTGAWDTPQVVHLLKRTLFGAAVQDINYFKTRTMSQAVDELLQPTAAPATPAPSNLFLRKERSWSSARSE